jgi:predicted transcriptional regulator
MVKKAKAAATEKLLTDVELELMTVLWKLGEGSVAEVMEGLPPQRDLAYTSVSTILRILEQKGILHTRKAGRGHIYIPTLAKSEYEAKTIKHVMNNVFDGAPVALVKQLLSSVKMKESDLQDLKALIDEVGSKK